MIWGFNLDKTDPLNTLFYEHEQWSFRICVYSKNDRKGGYAADLSEFVVNENTGKEHVEHALKSSNDMFISID